MEKTLNGHPVWGISGEEALKTFETIPQGLSDTEAEKRKKLFGANIIIGKKKIHALGIFLNQFASPLIFVLIGASVITVILREWVDTAIILLAVFINVSLAFYQEYRAENTIEKLSTYIKERTRVFRNGTEQEIDIAGIVPGDIVHLSYGSRIPADARLLTENGFSVDESILTGESLPVEKHAEVLSEGTMLPERKNMVFAGTLVSEGYATAVVSGTGAQTELGKIAQLVSDAPQEKTPLQKGVWRLAWIIFVGVIVIIAGVFFLGISRGEEALSMLLISAAVAVGAIPEALPITLTVILAVGAERIAKMRGIIRSLSAAETLGSATLVMTDKTGTLTMADMQLVSIYPLSAMDAATADALPDLYSSKEQITILSHALYTTDIAVENPTDPEAEWHFVGRAMEVGIAHAARVSKKIDVTSFVKGQRPILLPFNSTNKFAVAEDDDGEHLIIVGAPDVLLRRTKLSKDSFIVGNSWIEQISSEGKRLLGVAIIKKPKGLSQVSESDIHDIEFLGTLVFKDPLRPEAASAVKKIENLGVRVIMITGDLKGTALSVGKELGWDINEGEVLSGEEIRSLSDLELAPLLSHTKIFARTTPEDKLRIGRLFRAQGEVVAMTGDGVNDAPALRAVDIGVAIGSGSDVAKSVADLVLLDDNFSTIVSAIEEGRRMLANIRKSFVYLLSNSLDEIILIGGSLLVGIPLPLTALQIIWVNLFTESLPALAFAFDGNNDKMSTTAKGSGASGIFNREVKVLTIGVGVATSLLLFGLYWWLLESGMPFAEAQTILFTCFSAYVLVVAFSLRSLTKPIYSYSPFSNTFLNFSVFGAGLALILTLTVPPLRDIFSLAAPSASLWWIVLAWLVFNIIVVEVAKQLLRVRHTPLHA